MEKYFYSSGEKSFYPSSLMEAYVSAGTSPGDLLEITKQEFVEFSLSEPPPGMQLSSSEDGRPEWSK
ncbi:hypothetical protein, partial [Parasedimentitalea maritima]|uniref:hypothetical protein n=1 Tax=Parasedimentitalea maritima TaxID=2578117 RepID=UPI001ADC310B